MARSAKGGKQWAAFAPELAAWAWRLLVNRRDVWGGYVHPGQRGKPYTRADGKVEELGKTLTRPAVSDRGRVFLAESYLVRHFLAESVEDIVGLHTTSPANTSRWGAVEVDRHGEGGNDPGANLGAVLSWYDRLVEWGFRPLLTDSNGAGGYHLLVLFRQPVPTAKVFAFFRLLTADHPGHGLPARPEQFPKQPAVAPAGQNGQYGNWLRLPGRHHTREHWSTVWDGKRWQEGDEAVAYILSLAGDSPDLIPADLPLPSPGPRLVSPAKRVWTHRVTPGKAVWTLGAGRDGLSRRIAAYMAHLPNLGAGQGRDNVAFQFASFLVRDMALVDDIALAWLVRWDSGNSPPKGEARLREILADAHRYGRNPVGAGLRACRTRKRRTGHLVLSFRLEVT